MIISLIGMSNCGKSHWSKKLEAERGYERRCCDDLIAGQLNDLLPEVDITDMDAFAAWMGMPHEFGYAEREGAYLAGEEGALLEAVKVSQEDLVIDTTGSVIYLSENRLRHLKQISTVVYLSTTDDQVASMTEKFFACPKPLVWGECFDQRSVESNEQALRRCYPDLLRWRRERYKTLADVTIPYERSHDPSYSVDKFLYDVLQHKR